MIKSIDEIFTDESKRGDLSSVDFDNIPVSVGVIMDGNGRWAKKRALNRLKGHSAGIEAVRETIRVCNDLGVRHLTIYSFSTENWKRSAEEVDGLMDLFAKTLLKELPELHEEHVRLTTIGDLSRLPKETKDSFEEAYELTKNNDGLNLVVAVNYGARDEILHAVKSLVDDGVSSKDITEEVFEDRLYTAGVPDPEVIIRTSGEMRLSNFLLWQAAYSEFVVTSVLWPDFDRYEFLNCLRDYQSRDRRYGGIK